MSTKLKLSDLRAPRVGAVYSDGEVRRLRYRARPGGIFAEFLYKAQDGKWRSIPCGRAPTGEAEVEEAINDYMEEAIEASGVDDYGTPLYTGGTITVGSLVHAIREKARAVRREITSGADPRRGDALGPALEAYGRDLRRRKVVKAAEVLSLLRRELLAPFGESTPLASLTRPALVQRFRAVEESGRPGAARELRSRTNVFLGWCVNEGLLQANPLAGYRAPRRTRAERVDDEEHGRALADWELPILWAAADRAGGSLGAYLKLRLLCGQRRSETAAMRWQDISLERGVWLIPARVGKTRPLPVPLPPLVQHLLAAQQPDPKKRTGLVLPGRGCVVMSGWSKTLRPVYADTAEAGMPDWMPGDLRKTMRSGLSDLGVPAAVSELMLAHGPRDELMRRYDRSQRWPERCEAAESWAEHVRELVNGGGNVVPLTAARGAA
jgi:integrase